MRTEQITIATTHIDGHGECLAASSIQSMVDDLAQKIIPVWIEHDPRIPPVGRMVSGRVKELPDGELAAIAQVEFWEPGETVPFLAGRRMPDGNHNPDGLFVAFDRGFLDRDSQETLREIERILKCDRCPEIKKALDPLTVLTIGATFAATAIASGFLGQIGADLYVALKENVQKLIRAKRHERAESEILFVFKAFINAEGKTIEVDVILTNPDDEDLDRFFQHGLQKLEEEMRALPATEGDIQRLVFIVTGRTFRLAYGVRPDAVPVFPVWLEPEDRQDIEIAG